MRHSGLIIAAATLAYGGVLINTMPIWLVRLAAKTEASETLPGVLAMVVLIATAAGCAMRQLGFQTGKCNVLASLALVTLSMSAELFEFIPQHILLFSGGGFGLALGYLLHKTLSIMYQADDTARRLAEAISVGVLMSAVVLLVDAVFGRGILPILAGLSILSVLLNLFPDQSQKLEPIDLRADSPPWWHLSYLAFFLGMGAYWAFLESYAEHIGLGSISGWLFAGLVTSAMGSALASRLRPATHQRMLVLSLLAAAISGGVTYLATVPSVVGLSVCANGFFLFVFFPLYLSAGRADGVGSRLAVYLAGFALGGGLGALAVSFGGFTALALTVALSGFIAVPAALRSQAPQVV
ncbi:hypothetical protein JQV27_20010 [Sulfitobacter mediterraneus]|uniref:hypothetical protein n=2 Tax=Sulfitobacter mediterraneus TaxID=83219 RepID=UPI0019342DD3|nr:hypothetical protein [Sulfitobacter mediterraneus]MBM1635099.1 hypothetical protein [Sulfitobacter mediterraneus]MBM1642923.1 hypothetical protein [Sulfitobacter mediterraneus]MBM1646971.1 hypothetical protein [Sulfitobacter mediterraneus]MBM1651013.1 hypothetical protein [Sulfitobacter mediterraneus]MBM1655086.1 hypothetical protein [Sulfitobacter mediterraneus]